MSGHLDLAALREEYARGGLDLPEATDEPYALFSRWLAEAVAAGVHEPNAIVLSTVSSEGQPSSRMVLLKAYDADGFVFYTNQASRKGGELSANPRCSLLVPWHPLERQVRVEGTAEAVDAAEADAYFAQRPRGAQVGAWASGQSQVVASRAALAQAYAEAEERFEGGPVPRPPHWGGYRVRPHAVEFWQGRPGRMHDRLRYDLVDGAWSLVRLAP
ncbi:MAG: pyridoxamine 5'-phosphate oxidase [Nocardioides sp.]|uniref:pyridoxamine 5'-phosphate oxidase n=1 Tax=Nocardioides sp. TaxID=35761 RepID=UPI003F01EDFC